jgi:hypothetical protein
MSTNRQITHERIQSCVTVLCTCGWNHGMTEVEDRKNIKKNFNQELVDAKPSR